MNAPVEVDGVPNENDVVAGAAVLVPVVPEGAPNENEDVLLLEPNENEVPLVDPVVAVGVPKPGVVAVVVPVPDVGVPNANVEVPVLGCEAPNAKERPLLGCAVLMPGVMVKFMLEPVAVVPVVAGLFCACNAVQAANSCAAPKSRFLVVLSVSSLTMPIARLRCAQI